jgi:hypothetical protein
MHRHSNKSSPKESRQTNNNVYEPKIKSMAMSYASLLPLSKQDELQRPGLADISVTADDEA